MSSARPDNVQLILPARPEYARIARLTVAGLASRGGFGYDDVEDLRIAVGEACSLLLQASDAGDSLRFSFDLDEKALHIDAAREGTGDQVNHTNGAGTGYDFELSGEILDAVLDEANIDRDGHSIRMVKRRTDA